MVEALIRIAGERYTVAGVARAIGIGDANLPHGAGRTNAATAVDVGLIAVFLMVDAL